MYFTSFLPFEISYIFFIFFKFIYILYSYIYLFFIYLSYFCLYYFSANFFILYENVNNVFLLYELFKYDSLKYFVCLDILSFIKLFFNSSYLFLYYLFSGIITSLFKTLSSILMFFSFNYINSFDNFSYNCLLEFRTFTGKVLSNFLFINYDLNDYNAIYEERLQNRVGRRRGIIVKHNKINRLILVLKFRTLTFEYRIRSFLYKDTDRLMNMFLFENIISFRN